jgi:AraC-like DNA-binding protein
MLPQFYKVLPPPMRTINVVVNKRHHFLNPFHFHPELEISLILKSSGIRFVGDSVEAFQAGDLVFIGSSIPHCWRNDHSCLHDPLHEAEMLTIHFSRSFVGEAFYQLPECGLINEFLDKARLGVRITGQTQQDISSHLLSLGHQDGINRIITLLTILERLSRSDEIVPLASPGFVNAYSDQGTERINQVYLHVINNLSNNIPLREVASLTNLSETAFCRYFKAKTGKSFSTFLNQIRIGYACKLLIESPQSITQIAYDSGYNSLANFIIQFKGIMQQTPRQYQLKFRLLKNDSKDFLP